MARFFTGTDKAAWGATSVPLTASWSASFWWRRSGTPAANMRIFDFSTSFVSSDAGATPAIRLQRDYATTDGAWNVSYANLGSPDLTKWHHFCWTHVDGATPKLYIDGVSKTVTTATAPAGAIDTTTARTLTIGNRAANDRPTEGDIAWLGIYHRELTVGEVALTMHHGYAPTPAWLYPLLGDSPEPNYGGSSKNVTVTGSTVVNGPPTTPSLFVPEAWSAKVGGVTTHNGASASTWTFNRTTAGFATKAGASASTYTFTKAVAGAATKAGASASTWTFSATTAGAATKSGATASTYTLNATSAGYATKAGASASTYTLGAVVAGYATKTGASTSTWTFGATTAGARVAFGATASTYTFSATTAGVRTRFGAAASIVTFSANTAGVKTTFGSSATPITFNATTAGSTGTTHFGATVSTYTFGATTAGAKTTFGASAAQIAFGATTEAILGAFGVIAMPLVFNATTTPQTGRNNPGGSPGYVYMEILPDTILYPDDIIYPDGLQGVRGRERTPGTVGTRGSLATAGAVGGRGSNTNAGAVGTRGSSGTAGVGSGRN